MGVSGSGKTTIGKLLAESTGFGFVDGDDFHPAANVEKMRAGVALSDADREPWLADLRAQMDRWLAGGQDVVLACSALRRAYRQVLLGPQASVRLVYLKGSPALIAGRLATRSGHFMGADLLASQFATLEEPEGALVVDITPPPAEVVSVIASQLGLGGEAARL